MSYTNEPDFTYLTKRLPGMVYRCLADASRTMTFVSKGCHRLTGYLPEEMVDNRDMGLSGLVHPDDRALVEEKLRICLSQKGQQEITYRMISKSGKIRWVWEQTTLILSEAGDPVAFEGYLADITERKQAQDMLRTSECKYKAIFNQRFQFTGILTPDGILKEINQVALEYAGVSEADVLGKPFWEAPWWNYSESVQDRLRNAIQEAARGQSVRYETTHPAQDGSLHHIDFSLRPVRDDAGRVRMLIPEGRDITALKQTESELRDQLLFEQLISELYANFVHLSSDQTDSQIRQGLRHILEYLGTDKSILLHVSEENREMHLVRRWTSEGIEPLPFHTLDGKLPWTVERLRQEKVVAFSSLKDIPDAALQDRQTFLEIGHKSLLLIPLGIGRSVIGALGFASVTSERNWPDELIRRLRLVAQVFANVLAQTRAAEDIREREALYRILTENVADGVMLIQEGRVTFSNPAARAILGIPDTFSVQGKRVDEVLLAEDRDTLRSALDGLEKGTRNDTIFSGICRTFDDRDVWIEIRANVIRKGQKKAVLGTIRDITETRTRQIALGEEALHLRRENIQLRSTSKYRYRFGRLIGKSLPMQKVYELISQAAKTDANVIISGESGTGKELTARAIHEFSSRSQAEIVTVNCGAIPENLLESEFFGYKKGAFSGAGADKLGYLDIADSGTLFLDEIGEISLNMQVKLLRVIEGSGYIPVGGTDLKTPDIRFVAATNKDLGDHVSRGLMREDFYYRIHIIPIHLPPLRERKEDLPLLIDHFLETFDAAGKRSEISGEVMATLLSYEWPGNIRELQNLILRLVTLGKIELSRTPHPSTFSQTPREKYELETQPLKAAVEYFEKRHITEVLEQHRWHKGKAAAALGINRKTLFKKLKRHGIR